MKWKIFMMVCVSAFIISFPQNMIGCGPDADPYDYYTSYFNPAVASPETFRPFYYTGYNFLYNEEEPVNPADLLATEWANYCGTPVTARDAEAFVTSYALKDVSNLYFHIEKNQPLKIPDDVKRNSMTAYFIQQKDLEALGYVLYAKKAEPFVVGGHGDWDAYKRDSLAMGKLIKNGLQLYNASKKELFRLKYAYQVTRLAHYSGNFTDAITYYDSYVAPNKTASVLQDLALGLKAGALFRTGKANEAAYLFSNLFAGNDVKKISNYMGFKWAIVSTAERNDYLQLCKNDREKANMLALFAIGSTYDETETISKISSLDPGNKTLEVLVGREINKIEEKYFTPASNKEPGGRLFYYSWNDDSADSTLNAGERRVKSFEGILLKLGEKNNKALYLTAAAYCALMTKDFSKADQYLDAAKKAGPAGKLNDQWMLTNLLLTINESREMDAAAEKKILPSIKWLQQKAGDDKAVHNNWSDNSAWKIFYRNIMSGALAKKYHVQGDIYKEVLAIGAADNIFGTSSDYNSTEFLHNNTDLKDVEKLYALMTGKSGNELENFLLANNAVTLNKVIDFAGTAYLRNYDYPNAVKWLQKGSDKNSTIGKDPFIDLLYDREEAFSTEKKTATKLSFAQEMQRLQSLAVTDRANAGKTYYRIATGLYNMTYYGHAWELVQYSRSGSDGYAIPKDATEFQKQYYGCYAAHDMFKKAMDASADKNFKARCLFMMAKCAQKIVHRPGYAEFGDSYDKYDLAEKEYFPLFENNKYFPQLQKEYGTTVFYKEALSRCSYLRDFVKKK